MKYIKIYLIATLLAVSTAISSLPAGSIANAQQQKKDKNKKPAGEEGGQDDQVVKLGTQLVTVPFNVTDKKNRYITDLKKEDIDITEDNKPQQVFSFERQTDLPITIAMLIDISGSEEFTLPTEMKTTLLK